MKKTKVDYEKIYEYLPARKDKVITTAMIANAIGVDRIYGATMTKLVREEKIMPMAEKGYYKVL